MNKSNWVCLINDSAKSIYNILFAKNLTEIAENYELIQCYVRLIIMKTSASMKQTKILCRNFEITNFKTFFFVEDDDMIMLRRRIRTHFDVKSFGTTFIIDKQIVDNVDALKEWCKYSLIDTVPIISELSLHAAKHVIVFDLDNTLITDGTPVLIRDTCVLKSLDILKQSHLLVLWSYGNDEHVRQSLHEIKCPLNTFNVIICGGNKIASFRDDSNTFAFERDINSKYGFPKSTKIVMTYLNRMNYYLFKSFTLIDDKKSNQLNYDNFVLCKKAIKPINDWNLYHDIITNYIDYWDSDLN